MHGNKTENKTTKQWISGVQHGDSTSREILAVWRVGVPITMVPFLSVHQKENMPHVSYNLHDPAKSVSRHDLLRSAMNRLAACLVFTK